MRFHYDLQDARRYLWEDVAHGVFTLQIRLHLSEDQVKVFVHRTRILGHQFELRLISAYTARCGRACRSGGGAGQKPPATRLGKINILATTLFSPFLFLWIFIVEDFFQVGVETPADIDRIRYDVSHTRTELLD